MFILVSSSKAANLWLLITHDQNERRTCLSRDPSFLCFPFEVVVAIVIVVILFYIYSHGTLNNS